MTLDIKEKKKMEEGIEDNGMGTLRITVRRRIKDFDGRTGAFLHLKGLAESNLSNQPENGILIEGMYVTDEEIWNMIKEEFEKAGVN